MPLATESPRERLAPPRQRGRFAPQGVAAKGAKPTRAPPPPPPSIGQVGVLRAPPPPPPPRPSGGGRHIRNARVRSGGCTPDDRERGRPRVVGLTPVSTSRLASSGGGRPSKFVSGAPSQPPRSAPAASARAIGVARISPSRTYKSRRVGRAARHVGGTALAIRQRRGPSPSALLPKRIVHKKQFGGLFLPTPPPPPGPPLASGRVDLRPRREREQQLVRHQPQPQQRNPSRVSVGLNGQSKRGRDAIDDTRDAIDDTPGSRSEEEEVEDFDEAESFVPSASAGSLDEDDADEAMEQADDARSDREEMAALDRSCLYFHNVPFATSERELRELFGKFGSVRNLFLLTTPTGKFKGQGRVTFSSFVAAGKALRGLNGRMIAGRLLRLKVHQPPSRRVRGREARDSLAEIISQNGGAQAPGTRKRSGRWVLFRLDSAGGSREECCERLERLGQIDSIVWLWGRDVLRGLCRYRDQIFKTHALRGLGELRILKFSKARRVCELLGLGRENVTSVASHRISTLPPPPPPPPPLPLALSKRQIDKELGVHALRRGARTHHSEGGRNGNRFASKTSSRKSGSRSRSRSMHSRSPSTLQQEESAQSYTSPGRGRPKSPRPRSFASSSSSENAREFLVQSPQKATRGRSRSGSGFADSSQPSCINGKQLESCTSAVERRQTQSPDRIGEQHTSRFDEVQETVDAVERISASAIGDAAGEGSVNTDESVAPPGVGSAPHPTQVAAASGEAVRTCPPGCENSLKTSSGPGTSAGAGGAEPASALAAASALSSSVLQGSLGVAPLASNAATAGEVVALRISLGSRTKLVRHAASTLVSQLLALYQAQQRCESLVAKDKDGFEVGQDLTLGQLADSCRDPFGAYPVLELTLEQDAWA